MSAFGLSYEAGRCGWCEMARNRRAFIAAAWRIVKMALQHFTSNLLARKDGNRELVFPFA
jgi:hypothetical protein